MTAIISSGVSGAHCTWQNTDLVKISQVSVELSVLTGISGRPDVRWLATRFDAKDPPSLRGFRGRVCGDRSAARRTESGARGPAGTSADSQT